MSLLAGSVTVDDLEVASGSGWALKLYQVDVATFAALLPDPNVPPAGFSPPLWTTTATAIRLAALRERARQANAYAAADVHQITTTAQVTAGLMNARVPSGLSLGSTPNPNLPATPIVGPAVNVDLGVVGTGTVT